MLTCAEHGYRMIVELVDTHSDHIERELLGAIAALQPDGVILTPPHSENPLIIDLLVDHKISFARIGSIKPGPGFALTMDDERAARLATEHLIELGHARIGFIAGSMEYELSGWRVDGWREAMAAAGLATDGLLAQGDFSYDSGTHAARQLLESATPPTAIIASNDQMALATLAFARDNGIKIPADLSLISFDDTPIVPLHAPPADRDRATDCGSVGPRGRAHHRRTRRHVGTAQRTGRRTRNDRHARFDRRTAPAPPLSGGQLNKHSKVSQNLVVSVANRFASYRATRTANV